MTSSSLRRHAIWAISEMVISLACLAVMMALAYQSIGALGVGLWSLTTAFTSMLHIGSTGIAATLPRFLPKALSKGDHACLVGTICTSLFGILVAAALISSMPMLYGLRFFVSSEDLDTAKGILLLGLIAVPLRGLAGVFGQSLVGSHQTDRKCQIAIIAWLLRLAATLTFLPSFGVLALVIGQLVENLSIILLGQWRLRRSLRMTLAMMARFDWSTFRSILHYGIHLQGASLAAQLFEPSVRFVIGLTMNVETLGLYELASRLVTSIRQLVVTGVHILVPKIASLDPANLGTLQSLYQIVFDSSWLLGTTIMASLCMGFPLISYIWLGDFNPTFVGLGWLLTIGWWITLLGLPGYILALGLGWGKIILINQLTMTMAGVPLVILGAFLGGSIGLALGMILAFTIATLSLLLMVNQLAASELGVKLIRGDTHVVLPIALCSSVGMLWFPMDANSVTDALLLSSLSLVNITIALSSKRLWRLCVDFGGRRHEYGCGFR